MSMNRVALSGYIGTEPEVKQNGESTTCNFNLGVSRNFKDREGNIQTDWIRCVCFGKTAENISKFFHKGSFIIVDDGRIQTGSYTANDGTKRYTTDIVVNSFQFGPKVGDTPAQPTANNNEFINIPEGTDEELPF